MSITLPPHQTICFAHTKGAAIRDYATAYAMHAVTEAVAADRASRVPMTPEQTLPILCKWSDFVDSEDVSAVYGMAELIRAIEAHHGIGVKP